MVFGSSDAEANFCIKLTRRRSLQLMFQIGLHLDDLPLLLALKNKLQCGYITINHKEAKGNYVLSSQEGLFWLPIFDSFNLNTTNI